MEITLGKFQEPLLNLEKKLESGLYCELVSKELHDSLNVRLQIPHSTQKIVP